MLKRAYIQIPLLYILLNNILVSVLTLAITVYQGVSKWLGFDITSSLSLSSTCTTSYLITKYTYYQQILSISFVMVLFAGFIAFIFTIIVIAILIILKIRGNLPWGISDMAIQPNMHPAMVYILYILSSTKLLSLGVHFGIMLAFLVQLFPCTTGASNQKTTTIILVCLVGLAFLLELAIWIVVLLWGILGRFTRQQQELKAQIEKNTIKNEQPQQLQNIKKNNDLDRYMTIPNEKDNKQMLLNKNRTPNNKSVYPKQSIKNDPLNQVNDINPQNQKDPKNLNKNQIMQNNRNDPSNKNNDPYYQNNTQQPYNRNDPNKPNKNQIMQNNRNDPSNKNKDPYYQNNTQQPYNRNDPNKPNKNQIMQNNRNDPSNKNNDPYYQNNNTKQYNNQKDPYNQKSSNNLNNKNESYNNNSKNPIKSKQPYNQHPNKDPYLHNNNEQVDQNHIRPIIQDSENPNKNPQTQLGNQKKDFYKYIQSQRSPKYHPLQQDNVSYIDGIPVRKQHHIKSPIAALKNQDSPSSQRKGDPNQSILFRPKRKLKKNQDQIAGSPIDKYLAEDAKNNNSSRFLDNPFGPQSSRFKPESNLDKNAKLYFHKKKHQGKTPSKLKLYEEQQNYLSDNSYRSILPMQGGLQQNDKAGQMIPNMKKALAGQKLSKNSKFPRKATGKKGNVSLIDFIRSKYVE